MRTVHYRDLGLIDYAEAWELQTRLFEATIARKRANRDRPGSEQVPTEDHLLFCEHPHVYTLGKSGDQKHLLLNEEGLREQGVQFFPIDRGGDITYHGRGQIVGYPIFDMDHHFTDIHRFLRTLEEAVIGTLEAYNIKAGRIDGLDETLLRQLAEHAPVGALIAALQAISDDDSVQGLLQQLSGLQDVKVPSLPSLDDLNNLLP